mgnify:CR=1 FL=1
MSWTPISNTPPQYEENGIAASGYYIKFYVAGTTTPTAMATDFTGGTLLDKCQLNSEGYPINGSSAVFLPHIDKKYKIALFRNEADADSNNLANAAWPVDNLFPFVTESSEVTTNKNVKTVLLMTADITAEVGDLYSTEEYSTGNGSGILFFKVVGGGTGVDDGGSYIDHDSLALQFEQNFPETITPEMWGAARDGATIDTTALNNCNTYREGTVQYQAGTYFVDDTIKFSSKTTYLGVFGSTVIKSNIDSKPVGASETWISNGSPTGRCIIKGIRFDGLKTNLNQKAFVLRDYYSTLDHVTATSCGGGGIQLTHLSDNSTPTSGTLVENRIIYPIVRNCGGILLDLGPADNNKLTDGFLVGAVLDGEPALTVQHLFCGASAGWDMSGTHCYGSVSSFACEIQNGNNTRFTDFFIEAFLDRAVNATKIQGDITINGQINANSAAAGARTVVTAMSGAVASMSADIDIAVSLDVATASIDCVYNDAASGDIRAKVRVQGTQQSLLNKVNGASQGRIDQVRISDDVTIYGVVTDAENESTQIGITHDSKRLAYSFLTGKLSGAGVQSVSVPIKLRSFQKLIGKVQINGNDNDNGGTTFTKYTADIYISAKTNGSDAWIVNVDELTSDNAITGFSVNPVVTVTNTSADDGTVDIVFTFSSASRTGICRVDL